jgi:hypothetical protein
VERGEASGYDGSRSPNRIGDAVVLAGQGVFVLAGMMAAIVSRPPAPGRVRYETARAVVEYDEGALTDREMRDFAELVERGIVDIEKLVANARPGTAFPHERLRYVVSGRVQVSRAWRTTALLPLARVRAGAAPYLHETAHLLVPSRNGSTWLSEGFASYVESWVSEHGGGYDAHVFTRAGDGTIHRAAARIVGTASGQEVLPWVGREGEPPGLARDRERVARPFYVLSHSFTKYLVDAVGLATVLRLLDASDADAALEAETGRTLEVWRDRWLRSLATTGPARPTRRPGALR